MKRFIEGQSRTQGALLPERLDDFVSETNPVRVIDVFVDERDLRKLGFAGVDPAATGRPAYHPAALLKLYIYGYLFLFIGRQYSINHPAWKRLRAAVGRRPYPWSSPKPPASATPHRSPNGWSSR